MCAVCGLAECVVLVALKLQVLGLLPGVRAVFRVAGEIDTGNLEDVRLQTQCW